MIREQPQGKEGAPGAEGAKGNPGAKGTTGDYPYEAALVFEGGQTFGRQTAGIESTVRVEQGLFIIEFKESANAWSVVANVRAASGAAFTCISQQLALDAVQVKIFRTDNDAPQDQVFNVLACALI